jgi:hypothetical protein
VLIVSGAATTFAVTGVAAAVLQLAGLGPWPGVAVVWMILVAAGAARVALRPPTPCSAPRPRTGQDRTSTRIGVVLLGIAIALAAVLWTTSVEGTIPPNRDSANHAYFVARIARENTLDAEVVLAESPTNLAPAASYYPLTMHTQIAVAHRLTGVSVGELLLAAAMVAGGLWLPLGGFLLARRLVPDRPEVAGMAALIAVSAAVFPYQPMWWGGITLVVGLSLVPGTLAVVLWVTSGRSQVRPSATDSAPARAAVAAAAVAGTVVVHPSQLALLVVLFGAFAAADLLRARRCKTRDGEPRPSTPLAPPATDPASMPVHQPPIDGARAPRGSGGLAVAAPPRSEAATGQPPPDLRTPSQVVRAWGLVAVLSVVVLAPSTIGLASGAAERADHHATRHDTVSVGVQRLVSLDLDNGATQPVLGVLALIGVGLGWRERRLRPLLGVVGALAVLFLAAVVGGPLWRGLSPLTVPWYRSWWRLLYNVALFLPLLAALTLDELRRRLRGVTGAGVGVAIVALVPIVVLAPSSARTLRLGFENQVLLDDADLAVMERLAERIEPGTTVLNQENDATSWMYATEGLPAFSALLGFSRSEDATQRDWLLAHLSELDTDPRVRQLLDRWNIGYVMVDDRTYTTEEPVLVPSALLGVEGLHMVEHTDALWLWRVGR